MLKILTKIAEYIQAAHAIQNMEKVSFEITAFSRQEVTEMGKVWVKTYRCSYYLPNSQFVLKVHGNKPGHAMDFIVDLANRILLVEQSATDTGPAKILANIERIHQEYLFKKD